MKYLIFIVVTILWLASCKKDSETPPEVDDDTIQVTQIGLDDGDFELWKTFNQGNASYEEPNSGWWGTLNKLSYIGGPVTVIKDSSAYSGMYSAKLETKLWGSDFIITGILAAGYFDQNAPIGENLILGRPYTEKPTSLKGYFRYISIDSDSAGFYANLTRYDAINHRRDTIAEAIFAVYSSVNNYTLFEIPFEYYMSNLKPDTINVIFTSSAGGKDFIGNPGSTLYLDKVFLEFSDK